MRHRLLAAGIVVLAATGLTGCASPAGDEGVVSAGGTTAATRPPDRAQLIQKYRDCLAQQGIPLLDQPTDEGLPQIDKERAAPEKVSAAMTACAEYTPTAADAHRPAPEDIQARQEFAQCVREHGVPDYPDPDPRTGEERISPELARELKTNPQLPAAQQACQSRLPDGGQGTVGG